MGQPRQASHPGDTGDVSVGEGGRTVEDAHVNANGGGSGGGSICNAAQSSQWTFEEIQIGIGRQREAWEEEEEEEERDVSVSRSGKETTWPSASFGAGGHRTDETGAPKRYRRRRGQKRERSRNTVA